MENSCEYRTEYLLSIMENSREYRTEYGFDVTIRCTTNQITETILSNSSRTFLISRTFVDTRSSATESSRCVEFPTNFNHYHLLHHFLPQNGPLNANILWSQSDSFLFDSSPPYLHRVTIVDSKNPRHMPRIFKSTMHTSLEKHTMNSGSGGSVNADFRQTRTDFVFLSDTK